MIGAHRFRRLSLGASCAALLCALWASSSQAESSASPVTIGGEFVPIGEVKAAVAQCGENARDLSLEDCIDEYFVPRWLLDAQAKADKLASGPRISEKRDELLATRLQEIIAEKLNAPNEEQIEAYMKKRSRDFEKPLRLRIFRILVSSEEKAQSLIEKLTPTTTVADFRKLAREHSIDRATNERAGDLGFVWPDGSTDVPQVSAEPSLYEAALELEDGAFGTSPVVEGKGFAVLWRRGSLAAIEPNEEGRVIAKLRLLEERAESEIQALLKKLAPQVSARDDQLLGKLRRPEATLFREP